MHAHTLHTYLYICAYVPYTFTCIHAYIYIRILYIVIPYIFNFLKITCKDGNCKLNVTNFNWKENNFCGKFRSVKLAEDFLDRFEAAARYEPGT